MYGRFRQGLSKSRRSWVNPLSRAMANRRFDDDFWEEVENILIGADVGVEMTLELVARLRERIVRDKIKDPAAAMQAFREEIEASPGHGGTAAAICLRGSQRLAGRGSKRRR